MKRQYRNESTPVATKNCASDETSADISNCDVVFIGHTFSPKRNGYDIVCVVVTAGSPHLNSTSAVKFAVVANAHIANICVCVWKRIFD